MTDRRSHALGEYGPRFANSLGECSNDRQPQGMVAPTGEPAGHRYRERRRSVWSRIVFYAFMAACGASVGLVVVLFIRAAI